MASAEHKMEMAKTAEPKKALEYRLTAAAHYIKGDNLEGAGQALRDIQAMDNTSEANLREKILGARLALLKQDSKEALQLVQAMISTVAPSEQSLEGLGSTSGKRIALLLPSKGPHAEAAKTIKDGFLAAHYTQIQQQHSESNIKIYDTSGEEGVPAAYFQAMQDKAELIVGPLTKAEVQTIAALSTSVPILALNTIGQTGKNQNLYQFGIMPEDEVIAVTDHARGYGLKRALVIAPEGEWGQRMVSAFNMAWQAKGGQVVRTVVLNPNQALGDQLQSALGMATRAGQYFEMDMIFLAASPELGRQVKLFMNMYQASKVPVYATSAVYSGKPMPQKDHELDGVRFCDMPCVLNQERSKEAGLSVSPRHFALGLDAYRLAQQITDNKMVGGTMGATGNLHLEGHRIQRRLSCAKFEQGIPVPD